MDNFKKIIYDFWKNIYYFIKEYLYVVIFEKLYIKSIFALEEIPQFAISNSRAFAQLNDEEKKDLMKGLENISEYNQDFDHLRVDYILSYKGQANFFKFQLFLKEKKSGFYLKKAFLNFIFKSLLVLL